MASTPNLEHLSVLLSHSPEDRPTLDDATHQNTRRSLGALTGCPRLRTLAIIYGEPESPSIRSWCHRTLTDALPVLLADHFSSTPAPHPALETLKLKTTYCAIDLDLPRQVSKRILAPSATRGTDADVDAEFMFGEPPRNGAIDEEGEVVGGWWTRRISRGDRREEATKARARVPETGFCGSDE
ncbi:uncharacterized protein BXZ73DRAFT_108121 [Epithele typhae]|uniref:uncharacterized protein n=1 Tax=Epithele typhae TaxID=378194 RepID=UPI0020076FED|nr:uncharacterized protein BXZ73DRAFT_108121 [Epithele typhae]KAH9911303.1 hypothetical protein BXZ73DRAFT_108121 [Epithele typhae]